MIFRLILFGLYLLLKISALISSSFRARLKEKNFTMVIRTEDKRHGRTYMFSGGAVKTKSGIAVNPDFSMVWQDAAIGARTMFNAKNGPKSIMKAINNQTLKLEGDAAVLTWFVMTLDQMQNIYVKK